MIAGHQQATLDTGGIDHEIEARIYFAAGNLAGIVARYVDANNHLLLQVEAGGALVFYKKTAGAYTLLGNVPGVLTSGSLLKLRMVGNVATVFRNGVQVYTLTYAPLAGAGTRVGLNHYNVGAPVYFDDIRASSPPMPVTPVAVPFVISEISTSAPGDSPVWVEIPSRLRSASVRRGKQRWFDKVNAGTCTATFSNADRGLDPEYPFNILGSELKPGKRFRIRAIRDAVTYPIFDGYIDAIRQETLGPNDSVAIFTVTDGLAKLNRYALKSTFAVALASLAVQPNLWLRLGENSDATLAIDSSGGGFHGSYVGVHQSVDGLVALDPSKATKFPAGGGNYAAFAGDAIAGLASWSLSFGLKFPLYAGGAQFILSDFRIGKGLQVYVTAGPSSKLVARVIKEDGTIGATATGSIGIEIDAHFVTVVAAAGQPLSLWLDGVTNMTDTATGTEHGLTAASLKIGGDVNNEVTLDEVIAFPAALTLDQISALWLANQGWAQDSAISRFNRVLDAAGWSDARSFLGTFDDTLRATGLGITALAHLRGMEDTNEGRLFVTAAGAIQMMSRTVWITTKRDAIKATFGDAPGELPYRALSAYELSYSDVFNIVDRENNGLIFRMADKVSIDTYGPRDTSVASLYNDKNYENALASHRLAHLKNPLTHADSVSVVPGVEPTTLYPVVLGMELGERITVKRRPQGVGDPITMAVIVEGIAHDISPSMWATRFSIDAIGALPVADI